MNEGLKPIGFKFEPGADGRTPATDSTIGYLKSLGWEENARGGGPAGVIELLGYVPPTKEIEIISKIREWVKAVDPDAKVEPFYPSS